MSKLKEGTFVALDKNTKNIYVGGFIKDADGFIYKIDNYGRAVRNDDKSIHDLKDLKEVEVYSAPTDGKAPAEDPAARKKAKSPRKRRTPSAEEGNKRAGLQNYTDQDLADELRARGYRLTAKKTINVKL